MAKVVWGVSVVGPVRSCGGLVRLAVMSVRRRPHGVVQLRSGPVLGFIYPSQLVPTLVVFGDYIDPEMAFLRKVARSRWVVLDVGAAIGQFTVFAALLPVSHVHAFEPSNENIRTLRANLSRNGVAGCVTVHPTAVSDGDAEMVFPTSANPFLSRLDRPDGSVGEATVPVRTLTGIVGDLGLAEVGCLKINVAGFEAEVLAGADDFLSGQGAEVLVILISEGSGPWFAKIAAHGYRFFFYDPPTATLHEVSDLDNLSAHVRPSPARHLIGASGRAIDRGLLDGVHVVDASR